MKHFLQFLEESCLRIKVFLEIIQSKLTKLQLKPHRVVILNSCSERLHNGTKDEAFSFMFVCVRACVRACVRVCANFKGVVIEGLHTASSQSLLNWFGKHDAYGNCTMEERHASGNEAGWCATV